MTIQELFAGQPIDWKRTKLIRHNLSNDVVAANYRAGLLEKYQAVQTPTRFQDCDTLLSFLGTEGCNAVYQGCYRIGSVSPYDRSRMPEAFVDDEGMAEDCVVYELIPMDILPELKDRLVVEWGRGTINWCQKGTTTKEIREIKPKISPIDFKSYEEVLLSFEELAEIIRNKASHSEWEKRLSAAAGVYLITDRKTGKQYVGSASGEQGGLWGRWSEYVHTGHGGNKRLRELMEQEDEYCRNFQFSILETYPIKRDRNAVLECEQRYKKKLLTIEFGLNDN